MVVFTEKRKPIHAAVIPSEPTERLQRMFFEYGGHQAIGPAIPFGNVGPVMMLALTDSSPEVLRQIHLSDWLYEVFNVSEQTASMLRQYWGPTLQADCAAVQWESTVTPSESSPSEILDWLIRFGSLSDQEEETISGWAIDQPLPTNLSKNLLAVIHARKCGYGLVDIRRIASPKETRNLIRGNIRKRYPSLVFAQDAQFNYAVIDDPENEYRIENEVAANDSSRSVRFYIAPIDDIRGSAESQMSDLAQSMDTLREASSRSSTGIAVKRIDIDIPESVMGVNERGRNVDAERLFMKYLAQAARWRASDLHFEPFGSSGRVRASVDGTLFTLAGPDLLTYSLFNQVCTIALDRGGLRQTDLNAPSDGHFSFRTNHQEWEVRSSAMPMQGGPKIVFRLQPEGATLETLDFLDFSEQTNRAFRSLIHAPRGMILTTGPTGSGKTTTLYACLNEINKEGINIHTIEDPVEKTIPGLNQSSVRNEVGASFASLLRAVLRQAPNVILVGELRDQETLTTALQASMTGHLVFSTLHTNNAAEVPDRMATLLQDSYLVAQTLSLIQAQRLVKKLCPHCKRKTTLTDSQKYSFEQFGISVPENAHHYLNIGCDYCKGGHLGRRVASEAIIITDEVKDIISEGNKPGQKISRRIEQYCTKNGINTFFQDALSYVLAGEISLSEALRIANPMDRIQFESTLPA